MKIDPHPIFSVLDDPIAVLDLEGNITQVNEAWLRFARSNGAARHWTGIGTNYLEICRHAQASCPEAREILAGIQAVLAESVPCFRAEYACDSPSQQRWFQVTVTSLPLPEKGVVLHHHDISDRKRVELALRESEERFRLVATTAPVMIWMSGPDKLCNYLNQNWLDFTGRSLEANLGNGWAEGVHVEDFDRCLNTYVRAFDRREPFKMEYRLQRHDGEYRWILDIGVPQYHPDDGSFLGYVGSCTDITDHKLAAEALSNVNRKLIQAQEEERLRIARELHDDINQRLAFLSIDLTKIEMGLPGPALEMQQHILHLQERITELSLDVQALSHRLHSSKLDYMGIVVAARSFCRELSQQHEVKIEFQHAEIPRDIPNEIALSLYRVLQEALQNAVKHSRARLFQVELKGGPAEIQLTVSDQGVGFNPQDRIMRHGLGLISMRERLQLVKGELSIQAKPGCGATIRARVPLGTLKGLPVRKTG